VVVNTSRTAITLAPGDISPELEDSDSVFRLDASTGDRVVAEKLRGPLTLNGYGIGVITNDGANTIFD
jgi:hypothetical protein